MKIHIFLLLLCSSCFSNELKIGLVDSDFSYRILEQKNVKLMQLDTNEHCREATTKVKLDRVFCLNALHESNLASQYDAHGDDVVKNYLLENNTHKLIAVDITKHTDSTVFDVSMIAAYLLSESGVDVIIATTNPDTFGLWSVGYLEEVKLFRKIMARNRVLFWAVPNESVNLTSVRARESSEFQSDNFFIENNSFFWNLILVGSLDEEKTLQSAYPGVSEAIRDHFVSYSGYSHIVSNGNVKVGTSYSTPKLAGKVLSLAASCQLDLKTTMALVRKLSKATDVDYKPIIESLFNRKHCVN